MLKIFKKIKVLDKKSDIKSKRGFIMNIREKIGVYKVQQPIQKTGIKNNLALENRQNSTDLPNIRLSQIILPGKNIYSSNSLADFNRNNITVEIPKYYEPVENKQSEDDDFFQMKAYQKGIFSDGYDEYIDKKNNRQIIRETKNSYTEKGVLKSTEITEMDLNNTSEAVRYIKDYERNCETEIRLTEPLSRNPVNKSITSLYRNANGNIIKIEEYKMSDISGVYDITETDTYGDKNTVSKTTKDDNGNIQITKNLISLDGTKTSYRYTSDEAGNHKKLFNQITDKDGNVLATIDRAYDKTDENTVYSSLNGHKYKAEKTEDGIKITDYSNDKEVFIKKEDFYKKNLSTKRSWMMPDPEIYKKETGEIIDTIFNTIPPDMLLIFNNNVNYIMPEKDDHSSKYDTYSRILNCKTDAFAINHELGHSMDFPPALEDEDGEDYINNVDERLNYSNSASFRLSFIEEKAAFEKAFPDFEQKFIEYFIKTSSYRTLLDGREEIVAESNAINGISPKPLESLAMRTTLLQRYFPKSIAELTKMMTPIAFPENSSLNTQYS